MSAEPSINKVFHKSITLGNIIQIAVLIVGGIIGYCKLEWRISQLEQVKMETKTMMETNYKELRDAQTKLSDAVTRLIVMEEMRQRQTSNK